MCIRDRDRRHAYMLMDLGVKVIAREMFPSSLEIAEKALIEAGLSPERAAQGVATFRQYDEKLMVRQQAFYQDEASLMASTQQAMAELEDLFESDERAANKQQGLDEAEGDLSWTLSLTLSLGERELNALLPLPEGEGWGEG